MDEEIGGCGSLQQTLVECLVPEALQITDELFPRCHGVLWPFGSVQLQADDQGEKEEKTSRESVASKISPSSKAPVKSNTGPRQGS
jgi:hypothetical protein